MNYLIDTCSLVNLVRYYLPFDAEKKLYDCFKKQYERQEFILLPEVYKECSWGSQKVVTNSLDFLKELKNTTPLSIDSQKTHNRIKQNWVNSQARKKLGEKFNTENEKKKFIASADCQLILSAMKDKAKFAIVTDETAHSNDGKLFKKIPAICNTESITCITLPELLKKLEVHMDFSIPSLGMNTN